MANVVVVRIRRELSGYGCAQDLMRTSVSIVSPYTAIFTVIEFLFGYGLCIIDRFYICLVTLYIFTGSAMPFNGMRIDSILRLFLWSNSGTPGAV